MVLALLVRVPKSVSFVVALTSALTVVVCRLRVRPRALALTVVAFFRCTVLLARSVSLIRLLGLN